MGFVKLMGISGLSSPFRALSRDLRLIFICNFLGSFGDGSFAYLLPVYMRETLGASSVEVGILYAVMNLLAASTLFLAGSLADRYDRKKIMIIGWLSWLPAPLIFSAAGNWIQMLPGMVMWGFWLGGPAGTAYIIGAADRSKLTLTFTTMSAAWSAGYIFSPALGGYLAGSVGMRYVFYLAFIFYALASITLAFIRSQHATRTAGQATAEGRISLSRLPERKRLLRLSIFFASVMFLLMMFRPFVPQFLSDVYHYSDFEIGAFGSVAFLSSAVLGILIGRLGDRTRKSNALFASITLSGISLVLLLLPRNPYVMIASFMLAGGSYIMWSLMGAIVGPQAPESCRARWISIPQTASMFSSILAPYVGGLVYSAFPHYLFIAAIAIAVPLALLAFRGFLEEKAG